MKKVNGISSVISSVKKSEKEIPRRNGQVNEIPRRNRQVNEITDEIDKLTKSQDEMEMLDFF